MKMFDKLIVSEPEGADFKTRRSYFMVSSIVVGLLFVTAVVISIYAADFTLQDNGFELAEMIAPTDMAVAEQEPPKSQPAAAQTRSDLPTRKENMSSVDEPTIVPDTTSSARNTALSRPPGRYIIGRIDSGDGPRGDIGARTGGNGSGTDGLARTEQVVEDTTPPPPEIKDVPVRHPPTQSLGVINGRAASLPKPQYPAAAIAVHAEGKVDVQVSIDETGRVVSASAVSGHPLLRPAAESAARSAKFTPTYLSKVPVKVTGVIVYNFTR